MYKYVCSIMLIASLHVDVEVVISLINHLTIEDIKSLGTKTDISFTFVFDFQPKIIAIDNRFTCKIHCSKCARPLDLVMTEYACMSRHCCFQL